VTSYVFGTALLCGLLASGCALAAGQSGGGQSPAPAPAPAAAATPAAAGDPAAPPPTPAQAPAAVACCVIPAGTPVVVEITQALSAEKSKGGDHFGLRLAEPIVIGGVTVMEAGAIGQGEVVDAKPANIGGRPGRLVLAARDLEAGGVRVKLQSFKLGGGGSDHSQLAVGAVIAVGVLGALVTGGNVDYPAGTQASAKVAADVTAPPAQAPAQAPAQVPAQAATSAPAAATPSPLT
jgi:hypothetical protein